MLGDHLGDVVPRCDSLEGWWRWQDDRRGQIQENLVDGINPAGDGLEMEGTGGGDVRNHTDSWVWLVSLRENGAIL